LRQRRRVPSDLERDHLTAASTPRHYCGGSWWQRHPEYYPAHRGHLAAAPMRQLEPGLGPVRRYYSPRPPRGSIVASTCRTT
jgi:hypothetical protein